MENYDAMKKEIGQRVAEVRKRAGDKQTDLAEALGVDVRTYRTREIGTSFFPIPELIRIAERYSQTLDFLLTGKEIGRNDPFTDLICRLLAAADEQTKKTVLFLLEQRATNS